MRALWKLTPRNSGDRLACIGLVRVGAGSVSVRARFGDQAERVMLCKGGSYRVMLSGTWRSLQLQHTAITTLRALSCAGAAGRVLTTGPQHSIRPSRIA
jgi:hypothetical protein